MKRMLTLATLMAICLTAAAQIEKSISFSEGNILLLNGSRYYKKEIILNVPNVHNDRHALQMGKLQNHPKAGFLCIGSMCDITIPIAGPGRHTFGPFEFLVGDTLYRTEPFTAHILEPLTFTDRNQKVMRIERFNDSLFTLYIEQLGVSDEVEQYVRLKDGLNFPGLQSCGTGYGRGTYLFTHPNGRQEKLTSTVFTYAFKIKEPGAVITFERDDFYHVLDALPFPELKIARPRL